MALDVRIIVAGGNSRYLVNSTGSPTPGGSPNVASTTPYSVVAASWTQTATKRQTIYSGGPPFRVGSTPLYVGFGNTTEELQIGIAASSSDNMADLIQKLRLYLNQAAYSQPALLYWKPSGATNPVYFEIYSADVQETGEWNNPAAGFLTALVRVTITRSMGGWLSAGETQVSAVSYTNSGTSGLNYSSLAGNGYGDLAYDGQPLNVQMVPSSAGTAYTNVLMSAVTQPTTVTTGIAATYAGLAGGGVVTALGSSVSTSISYPVGLGDAKRVRVLIRGTGSANAQIRAVMTANGQSVPGPWVAMPASALVYDLGGFPIDMFRAMRFASGATATFTIQARSTNASTTSVTITYCELLTYHAFASVVLPSFTAAAGDVYLVDSFPEETNIACLPHPFARVVVLSSGGSPKAVAQLRGTPPIFKWGGVYLWLAWQTATAHSTTAAATVTATSAPLYHTLRGAL